MDLLKAILKAIAVVGTSIILVALINFGLNKAPILTIILFFSITIIIGTILFYYFS